MKGGGVNDAMALNEKERKFLDRHVENLLDAQAVSGRELIGSDNMIVRLYQHIGVLDNRIVNFGQQYRAVERAAESLGVRAWDEGFAAAEGSEPAVNPYRKSE